MKVRLLSDLHLEFEPFDLSYQGEDVLVLAGDISAHIEQTMTLVRNYLEENKHPQLIFILGNHDYYHKSIRETYEFYENVNIDRFHYLQDDSIVINGIRFYGATLWTDMDNGNKKTMLVSSHCINDYYQIKGSSISIPFTPAQSYVIHCDSKKRLIKCLDESKEPVVVVSHHLPSHKSIDPKYKSFPASGSFASHLDDLVVKAHTYIHGHTHTSLDYKIQDTRVLCNPRGYSRNGKNENPDFNPCLIIEI
jgi:predicted phosphodiesterase